MPSYQNERPADTRCAGIDFLNSDISMLLKNGLFGTNVAIRFDSPITLVIFRLERFSRRVV